MYYFFFKLSSSWLLFLLKVINSLRIFLLITILLTRIIHLWIGPVSYCPNLECGFFPVPFWFARSVPLDNFLWRWQSSFSPNVVFAWKDITVRGTNVDSRLLKWNQNVHPVRVGLSIWSHVWDFRSPAVFWALYWVGQRSTETLAMAFSPRVSQFISYQLFMGGNCWSSCISRL